MLFLYLPGKQGGENIGWESTRKSKILWWKHTKSSFKNLNHLFLDQFDFSPSFLQRNILGNCSPGNGLLPSWMASQDTHCPPKTTLVGYGEGFAVTQMVSTALSPKCTSVVSLPRSIFQIIRNSGREEPVLPSYGHELFLFLKDTRKLDICL